MRDNGPVSPAVRAEQRRFKHDPLHLVMDGELLP